MVLSNGFIISVRCKPIKLQESEIQKPMCSTILFVSKSYEIDWKHILAKPMPRSRVGWRRSNCAVHLSPDLFRCFLASLLGLPAVVILRLLRFQLRPQAFGFHACDGCLRFAHPCRVGRLTDQEWPRYGNVLPPNFEHKSRTQSCTSTPSGQVQGICLDIVC